MSFPSSDAVVSSEVIIVDHKVHLFCHCCVLLTCRNVSTLQVFYGVMSSNHPELMHPYPNPLLDFVPSAKQYAIERSQASLNRTCGGLHFPHVLAPWGVPQYSTPYPNYSDREGA